jgi:antitoxin component of MazEF toxin-antitoxin module
MEQQLIKVSKGRRVALPRSVEKVGLHDGTHVSVEIEDNAVILRPVIAVPKSQAWFWEEEWQKGEKEAERDIEKGQISKKLTARQTRQELGID